MDVMSKYYELELFTSSFSRHSVKNPFEILSPWTYNDHGMKNLEIGFWKKLSIDVISVLGSHEGPTSLKRKLCVRGF